MSALLFGCPPHTLLFCAVTVKSLQHFILICFCRDNKTKNNRNIKCWHGLTMTAQIGGHPNRRADNLPPMDSHVIREIKIKKRMKQEIHMRPKVNTYIFILMSKTFTYYWQTNEKGKKSWRKKAAKFWKIYLYSLWYSIYAWNNF